MKDVTESTPFLVIGNWKMNGTRAQLCEFAHSSAPQDPEGCKRVLCLPSVLLPHGVSTFSQTSIEFGGQNCHESASGAFTGEISASMLADAGAKWVILGYSERREGFGETDALVRSKAVTALSVGLIPIICIGESLEDRDAGRHLGVILAQLEASTPLAEPGWLLAIAYEPIWAIGSGISASEDQVLEAHEAIANWLRENRQPAPVLYGGSVKPETAAGLASLDHVDGFLIGGASLNPLSFDSIADLSAAALSSLRG